jgi:hypothetical protein
MCGVGGGVACGVSSVGLGESCGLVVISVRCLGVV